MNFLILRFKEMEDVQKTIPLGLVVVTVSSIGTIICYLNEFIELDDPNIGKRIIDAQENSRNVLVTISAEDISHEHN